MDTKLKQKMITPCDIQDAHKNLRTAMQCSVAHGGECCDQCKGQVEKTWTWLELKAENALKEIEIEPIPVDSEAKP